MGALFHSGQLCGEHFHALDWASPVCRGDGKPPVPVFLRPLAFEHKEQLYFWESQFDFKCDRCRLVSHVGDSTDGGRHTRIGEFDPKRNGPQTAQQTKARRSGQKKGKTSAAPGSRL